jgi:precorrin-2 dehydrogenase/sirohydrochlorin ferrochelatase
MNYYPIHLDIRNRCCLVVGGGAVGTRKACGLLDCGARVTVVSPEVGDTLQQLALNRRLCWHPRGFESSDLDGVFLVFAATDIPELNGEIQRQARQRHLLCNVVNRPEGGDFILPSVVRRQDLVITVSTSGKSPAFAKKWRKDLEKTFGTEYGLLLRLMGAIRYRLLQHPAEASEAPSQRFARLVSGNLLELIRAGDVAKIDAFLQQRLGAGFDYQTLIQASYALESEDEQARCRIDDIGPQSPRSEPGLNRSDK